MSARSVDLALDDLRLAVLELARLGRFAPLAAVARNFLEAAAAVRLTRAHVG